MKGLLLSLVGLLLVHVAIAKSACKECLVSEETLWCKSSPSSTSDDDGSCVSVEDPAIDACVAEDRLVDRADFCPEYEEKQAKPHDTISHTCGSCVMEGNAWCAGENLCLRTEVSDYCTEPAIQDAAVCEDLDVKAQNCLSCALNRDKRKLSWTFLPYSKQWVCADSASFNLIPSTARISQPERCDSNIPFPSGVVDNCAFCTLYGHIWVEFDASSPSSSHHLCIQDRSAIVGASHIAQVTSDINTCDAVQPFHSCQQCVASSSPSEATAWCPQNDSPSEGFCTSKRLQCPQEIYICTSTQTVESV